MFMVWMFSFIFAIISKMSFKHNQEKKGEISQLFNPIIHINASWINL